MEILIRRALLPLVERASEPPAPNANGRRFCILHLDGLSRQALEEAIEHGQMPFLARLIASGRYRLSAAWSGAPASTPAFQAGLLYGAGKADIPSFTWFDREKRRLMRMDSAPDAARVESTLRADGQALLSRGSAAFSIFPGGAPMNAFSRSPWGGGEVRFVEPAHRHEHWQLCAATAAHSVTAARIVRRLLSESLPALADIVRWSRGIGRWQHEPTFFLNRVGLAVGAREAATWGTVLDMVRGVPAVYTCFSDYDEIAHRRQPDAQSAFDALGGIDWSLEHIFAAAEVMPFRRYDFYVLSDHGQVVTEPFEAVTGVGLLDYLALARVAEGGGAPWVDAAVVRRAQRLRAIERSAAGAMASPLRRRVQREVLDMARALRWPGEAEGGAELTRQLEEIECVEAGDLAHIYLGGEARPLECADIERRFPSVLRLIVETPAIGVVAARQGKGGVAFWRRQKFDLMDAAGCQALDLGYGGDMTRAFLLKMLSLPSAGDLVVYGNGADIGGRHVAFSWEFGSHAGIGREEVETFVIHPASIEVDFGRLHHSAELHRFFRDRYGVR